jgi:epsilon-lactone hydrolase
VLSLPFISTVLSISACVAVTSGNLLDNDHLPQPAVRGASKPSARNADLTQVPAFELPSSEFLDDETRELLQRERAAAKPCAVQGDPQTIAADRDCLDLHRYLPMVQKLTKRYSVSVQHERIAQVSADIILPTAGIAEQNKERLLINLHGGSFIYGDRYGGQLESIAIAAVGKIKVVAVHYRQPPEHPFPAGALDAVAVYEELLKAYRPETIGVFGCSAGAVLTAQLLAQLQLRGLPMPGAVGMFGGGALPFAGDSHYTAYAQMGQALRPWSAQSSIQRVTALYAAGTNLDSPAFAPGKSPQILSRFPPSLFISSTRDIGLSAAVMTHSQLVKLGVPADLHVWEGVDHCFQYNPDLPASREAYDVAVRFFDRFLGQRGVQWSESTDQHSHAPGVK